MGEILILVVLYFQLNQDSQSESEVKEDDDLGESGASSAALNRVDTKKKRKKKTRKKSLKDHKSSEENQDVRVNTIIDLDSRHIRISVSKDNIFNKFIIL